MTTVKKSRRDPGWQENFMKMVLEGRDCCDSATIVRQLGHAG
jgi:hypothetical protein